MFSSSVDNERVSLAKEKFQIVFATNGECGTSSTQIHSRLVEVFDSDVMYCRCNWHGDNGSSSETGVKVFCTMREPGAQ